MFVFFQILPTGWASYDIELYAIVCSPASAAFSVSVDLWNSRRVGCTPFQWREWAKKSKNNASMFCFCRLPLLARDSYLISSNFLLFEGTIFWFVSQVYGLFQVNSQSQEGVPYIYFEEQHKGFGDQVGLKQGKRCFFFASKVWYTYMYQKHQKEVLLPYPPWN